MERRVIIWVLATTLCLMLYLNLQPRPAAPGRQANQAAPGAQAQVAQDPAAPLLTEPRRWWTLGSMNPADGFNLLVTLTNTGAGIERIELTEREPEGGFRYERTDVRHGYLGYLAISTPGAGAGAQVNVVGPGTPAALAQTPDASVQGLRSGDVIIAVDDSPIEGPADLEQSLEQTRPGRRIRLTVLRPTAGPGNVSQQVDVEPRVPDEANDATAAQRPQTLHFVAELTEHPLDLIRLSSEGGEDEIRANRDRLSCLLALARLNEQTIPAGKQELPGLPSLAQSRWQNSEMPAPTEVASELEFRLAFDDVPEGAGAPLEIVRRYRLRPANDATTEGYGLDLETEVINHGEQPQQVAYRLQGPNGLTLEGWWYLTKISPHWGGAGARDVIFSTPASGHSLLSPDAIREHAEENPAVPQYAIFSANEPADRRAVRYLALDGQYFTCGFVPHEDDGSTLTFQRASAFVVADPALAEKSHYRALNVSYSVDSESVEVPPGGTRALQRVRLFAGPKRPELLDKYHLGAAIEYGWFPLVAVPLQKILHTINWPVGNYAIAIVLLTVLVRACLFPLGRRAAIHAQKMQELAPELKKINDKYKDDLQKRMEAQRELQRRVGFNPLSGCLPIFIQIPIFIGLYRCLSVDIELRQAELFQGLGWCSNLAAPDQLWEWRAYLPEFIAGRGAGWLGPYFNLLPVIVVILFLIQQKMFMPPATDEQTLMTQKIMNFMTVIMGVFFFKVPAGLCIYFITSSLWSMAERKLVKRTIPAAPAPAVAGGAVIPAAGVTTRVVATNGEGGKRKRRKPPKLK